jgi:hypothetical protein
VADGNVNSIALDGTVLYLGGSFLNVDGTPRPNAAALDVGGALTSWNPAPDGIVFNLQVSGGSVFLAGNFANVVAVANGDNYAGLLSDGTPDAVSTTASALNLTGSTDGTPFAPLAVWGNALVVINGNTDSDAVTIDSASNAHGNADLTIEGGVETATVAGAVTLTGDLAVTADSINLNSTEVIQTGGTQTYPGPVSLGADVTLGSRFVGRVDEASRKDAAVGGEGGIVISCSPDLVDLTRTNPALKSDATRQAFHPGDRFGRYDTIGQVEIWWGRHRGSAD